MFVTKLDVFNKGRDSRNLSSGFPTSLRSDTNRAVQPQNMVKGLKFWIYKVEGLYYLCSENKDADQLICAFVLAYAKNRISHEVAHIVLQMING